MSKREISDDLEKKKSGYKPLVPAVEQAAHILIFLAKNPHFKVNLTEICEGVGIHKSKGFSILHTLRQFGFVEKDPKTKSYYLGPGLLYLSRRVLDQLDLREIVTPFLEKLAEETNSTALLGLISDDQVFVVSRHAGNQNVGLTIGIGHSFPLTAGAHGKAIVAHLPEPEQAKIMEKKKLYFYGDPGKLDLKRLKEELQACRQSGFAKDLGGLQAGINAVSAPLLGPNSLVMGCIILIGTFSEDLIQKYGPKVAKAGQDISLKLGGQPERNW
jgi:DNA-binding IclR family transcriptional regulator